MNKKTLLLKKEMLLTASPLSYLFIAFAAMALIPNYPILLGGFFVCFGIFHSFQAAREAGDIFYTNMLPVEKKDVVKSKFIFTVFIQMISWILMTALTLFRMKFLSDIVPYSENSLLNANLTFLGFILIIFGVFNLCFLSHFFKTAYKIGGPFILFCVVTFVAIALAETLHFIPGLEALGDGHFQLMQLWVFLFGILFYVAGTFISLKLSIQRFEKIDL